MDPIKLIEAVEAHPALWDKGVKSTNLKDQKDKSWILVAEKVVGRWDNLNDEEKTKQLQIVKRKWKNIKDYYSKTAESTNGDPAKRKKHNLEDKLHFLSRRRKRRSPVKNFVQTSHVPIPEPPANSETDTDQPQSKAPKHTKTPLMTPFQKSLIQNLQAASALVKSSERDPDKCYILSLTDDYKSLKKEKKYAFQRLVADFFCSIYHSNQTSDSSSATPNFSQHEQAYSPLQQPKSEQDDPLSNTENKCGFSYIQSLDFNSTPE